MTLQDLGQMNLGSLLPIGVLAAAQLDASLAVAMPQLSADLDQLANVNASLTAAVTVPVDPTAALRQALALFTSGQLLAALTAGFSEIGVNIQADLAVNTGLLEALARALEELQRAVQFSAHLKLALGQPGVYAYAGASTAAQLGPDVSARVGSGVGGGSPMAPVHALLVVVPDPGVWATLSTLVRVS